MKDFAHRLVYEFRSGLRDKSQILMNYLFRLVFFALMGALMSKVNSFFGKTMIPAMSLFALMCTSLLSLPSSLVMLREPGLLRYYRINGMPSWAVLAAPPLANFLHMAIVSFLIAVAGKLALGADLPLSWPRFVLAWFAAWASPTALGSLVAAFSSSSHAAILIAQLVYIPSIIFGGLMMPADILPAGLAGASRIFPASHAMPAFAGGPGSEFTFLVLASGALLCLLVSLALYAWDRLRASSQH